MNYYGTRLSKNISLREPEGYLLCLNVPVARTGYQEYWAMELGLPGNNLINVYRPEEEVFSPETMASFEGMPVTDDHPEDGVTIDNHKELAKGHASNIRRGKGDESDLLLADLIIDDPELIDKIMKDDKREISCGYTYELSEEGGRYIQRQIRGNHVAVVDAGRAGHRVCIKDHATNKPERSKSNMKKSLSKLLARMAKDGDIETVAEIIEEMMEPEGANPAEETVEAAAEAAAPAAAATPAATDPAVVVETEEGNTVAIDADDLAEIISRLDRLIELLSPAPAPATDDDPVEEIAEAVEEALEASVVAEEEPVVLPDEELPAGTSAEEVAAIIEEVIDPVTEDCDDPDNQEVLSTGDALRSALKAVRPALAKMPKRQRQRVCADIAARLKKSNKRGASDAGVYAAIGKKKRPAARYDDKALGLKIMASRNANSKK